MMIEVFFQQITVTLWRLMTSCTESKFVTCVQAGIVGDTPATRWQPLTPIGALHIGPLGSYPSDPVTLRYMWSIPFTKQWAATPVHHHYFETQYRLAIGKAVRRGVPVWLTNADIEPLEPGEPRRDIGLCGWIPDGGSELGPRNLVKITDITNHVATFESAGQKEKVWAGTELKGLQPIAEFEFPENFVPKLAPNTYIYARGLLQRHPIYVTAPRVLGDEPQGTEDRLYHAERLLSIVPPNVDAAKTLIIAERAAREAGGEEE